MRDAIYGELLRGRRVRYHHKIAVATERVHADSLDTYVNELAHHFYMGAALADADKADPLLPRSGRAGAAPARVRGGGGPFHPRLEVAEKFGPPDPERRCDALIALAEAQNRAGDTELANANFERAAALARSIGDPERLAAAALRAGPLSYLGIVGAHEEQMELLEEALAALPERRLAPARPGDGTARSRDRLRGRRAGARRRSSGRSR